MNLVRSTVSDDTSFDDTCCCSALLPRKDQGKEMLVFRRRPRPKISTEMASKNCCVNVPTRRRVSPMEPPFVDISVRLCVGTKLIGVFL